MTHDKSYRADHTVDRDHRPIVDGPNKVKIAIFGANVSTGQAGFTHADGTIALNNWDEIKGLAQKADRAGLEGFIPIARWQGLSGPERPWGRQFETFTWAAGLAAVTEQIQIFATCHVPFFHPLMAAKMTMTIDHISGGRVGLNATAGYHRPEFEMFGLDLPEHDKRYELASEWMTVVERLWSDEGEEDYHFDHDGEFFTMKGAEAYPKPVQTPGPVVMSAGASPAGQKFAFDHANVLFAAISDVENAGKVIPKLRANADAADRPDIGIWSGAHIICKDTEKEANDYLRYVVEQGDWESSVKYTQILKSGGQSIMDWNSYKETSGDDYKNDEFVKAFITAGLLPLVGTPEMIVEKLQKLSDSGVDGICTGLVDYDEGLDRLDQQIIPLMRDAGLRV